MLERYTAGFGPNSSFASWSMAKSITHALVGIAVGDGLMDPAAPADVPEWRAPSDLRGAITLDQLLRMSSGLRFVEDYVPEHPSDVIEMLFGRGKGDVAAFAAGFPLDHPPGTHWAYASGTTNIVARALGDAVGRRGPALGEWMRERLFTPLGMRSAEPRFDAAGTFVGSSYCPCSARDFLRFALLHLRDGVWDGARLLPAGWVDYARTPTPQPPRAEQGYGAHWWLGLAGPGSFSAQGYEGQFALIVPEKDLALVRLGRTPLALKDHLPPWVAGVAGAFAAVA